MRKEKTANRNDVVAAITAVPTMIECGMIIFLLLARLGLFII